MELWMSETWMKQGIAEQTATLTNQKWSHTDTCSVSDLPAPTVTFGRFYLKILS